ncbi:MAG: DUF11 domain-containing protein [Candidatus Thorarchaeota archaeon]
MKKRNYALFAVFLAVTLVLPSLAASSQRTPTIASTHVAAEEGPRIATIEVMGTHVDAWGGVTNIVASLQNATHYVNSHFDALDTVVINQMQTADGYVAQVSFQLSGLVPFPNGAVGGPMAVLQLSVLPIIEVPMDVSMSAFADLSESEALGIAQEIADVYDAAIGINLDRFVTVEMPQYRYWNYDETSVELEGSGYQIAYLAMLDLTSGETAMGDFLDILADMGGFMGVVDSPNWPDLFTQATEVYFPAHWTQKTDSPSNFVGDLLGRTGDTYIRAHPTHVDLVEEVQSAVLAQVSFSVPGYVDAVAGDETYSLLDHLEESGVIMNKMAEDPTAAAISVVAGVSPGSLDIVGIPADWTTVDDQFEIPETVEIPGGISVPAGSTVSDLISTYLSHMPREFALMANSEMEGLEIPPLDDIVDGLWGGGLSILDYKQAILNLDYGTFPDTPLIELDIDLLAALMDRAGLTPAELVSRIDDSLASTNPLAAIAKAFIQYFDAYGILDILDNDVYADPVALESYLNTFGDGLEQFLSDFGGIDLPAEFKSKEAISTFLNEHWGIALGAVWTAMAADNLQGIKDALNNMLDFDTLRERVVPYLMADLGASLAGGIGFEVAINMDFDTFQLVDLSAELVLTFDADPDTISFDGPYLVVSKNPSSRTVSVGGTVDYNITVHNYGSATAYDVLVVDGMSSGLDGEREFFWTRGTLAAGAEWVITYSVSATDSGLYEDMPAICAYFNTTLASFDSDTAEDWTGSSFYTWSAPGYQVLIQGGGGGFWDSIPTEILGIPTLYVGVGGVGAIAVIILLVRRR